MQTPSRLDRDTALAQKTLDVLDLRAKVILHNIANQNVPGFKRYAVRFEELMQAAQSAGRSVLDVQPEVERDQSGPAGQNNVSLLDEMTILDKVRLTQDVMTRHAGAIFAQTNRAIFGR